MGIAMSAVWWSCDQEYRHKSRTTLLDLKQSVTDGRSLVAQSVLAVVDSWTLLERPLETLPQLGALLEKHLVRAPWCPACHKAMHVQSAKPDKACAKLRHVLFHCHNCGWMSDQLVAVA
jgi:hypothetical protein